VPAVQRALAEAQEQKARKKAEEELREAHRNLESQIEERTAELKKQLEHRSRIEASLLKYNEQLEILSYTASQLLESDKPRQLVEELCGKVMKFLDCDVFFNFIVDDSVRRLHLNAYAGIAPETAHEIEWLDYGVAVCGCVARDGFKIVAENIPATPDVRTELIKSFGIKAYACHPLLDQKRVLGTLSFGTRNRTNFSADDLAMMKAVADQVAIAMVRIRSEEKLRQITERFEMAQQAAEVGTWDWDVVSGHIEWSTQMFKLFGLDPRENTASFKSWKSIIHPEDAEVASRRIDEALLHKTTLKSEYRIVLPDGQIRWINAIGEGKYDSQGRPVRMIGICLDITGNKKAEESLHESEERYRELVQSSPEAVIVHSDRQFLYANPAALRLYGAQSIDQLREKTILDLIPEDERAIIAAHMKQGAAGERLPLRETKLLRLDGQVIPVESIGGLITYDGKPAMQVMIRDITERKQAEKELHDSETRYRRLFESAKDGILILNVDTGKVIDVNPFLLKLLGYSYEELYGKFIWELGAFKDIAASREAFKTLQDKEYNRYEDLPLETRDGRSVAVEVVSNVYLVDHNKVIQCNIRDITERKRMETQQENFNRTLRAINKSNQVMMRATDEYAYMEEICKIIVEDCGYSMVWIGFADDDENKTVRPVAFSGFEEGYISALKITWADTERGQGPTGTAIRTGKPATCTNMLTDPRFEPWRKEAIKRGYKSSIVLPLKTGDKVFGALTIYSTEPDSFVEDEVKLLAELANDLSHGIMAIRWQIARVKVEGELRAERDFTTAVLDTAGAAVVVLDKAGRITRFNRTCEILTGYAEAEVLGRVFWEFLIPKDELAGVHQVWEALRAGDFPNQHENHWVAKDGSRRLIAWANTAIVRPQGEIAYIIGTGVDITERKTAEDQLAKQAAQLQERKARLEEINSELESFSYSISHDLRAPLRAINGFSRIIQRQEGDKFDEKTRHQFNLIRDNIKLMGVLIEVLLSFSRVQKTSMSISVIDMDKLAREVWDEIREANKERKLIFKIKKIPLGYGDHTLIRQVLFNLFSNAVKFTKNKKQGIIEMSSYKDTGKTVYCIKDNGAGFDMEHCDKLFGVFQRLHSNEEYEGTGIGLAIVQRIVSRHGGRVWAEGEVDKGATFFFTLNSVPIDIVPEQRRKRETVKLL